MNMPVNTASRMESNGVKGMIHCSEETARLLPERWLIEREDRIVAKGKGEMRTFFVKMSSTGMSGSLGRSMTSTAESDRVDDYKMTKENLVKLGVANFLANETRESESDSPPQVHQFQDEYSLDMDEIVEV